VDEDVVDRVGPPDLAQGLDAVLNGIAVGAAGLHDACHFVLAQAPRDGVCIDRIDECIDLGVIAKQCLVHPWPQAHTLLQQLRQLEPDLAGDGAETPAANAA